jgi:hypothetical protein
MQKLNFDYVDNKQIKIKTSKVTFYKHGFVKF